MKLIIPLLICTLFCTAMCCTPIIKTAKIEKQKAKADSVLARSPEKQKQIDQEKKYHAVGAKISVVVLIGWFLALENFKEKD